MRHRVVKLDPLGFEPRAFRMRSGCDTTTPCARLARFNTHRHMVGAKFWILMTNHLISSRHDIAMCERRWTHWGLNPGPSACRADVIPLHHVPDGAVISPIHIKSAAWHSSCSVRDSIGRSGTLGPRGFGYWVGQVLLSCNLMHLRVQPMFHDLFGCGWVQRLCGLRMLCFGCYAGHCSDLFDFGGS